VRDASAGENSARLLLVDSTLSTSLRASELEYLGSVDWWAIEPEAIAADPVFIKATELVFRQLGQHRYAEFNSECSSGATSVEMALCESEGCKDAAAAVAAVLLLGGGAAVCTGLSGVSLAHGFFCAAALVDAVVDAAGGSLASAAEAEEVSPADPEKYEQTVGRDVDAGSDSGTDALDESETSEWADVQEEHDIGSEQDGDLEQTEGDVNRLEDAEVDSTGSDASTQDVGEPGTGDVDGEIADTSEVDVDGGAVMENSFVLVRAGSFFMGTPVAEIDYLAAIYLTELREETGIDDPRYGQLFRDQISAEEPYSLVTLTRDFYLQEHEVTRAEWATLFDDTVLDECPNCPAVVSSEGATQYANAFSELSGLTPCYAVDGTYAGTGSIYDCEGYRLPTEAEWEYASRAGTVDATYAGEVTSLGRCDGGAALLSIAWFQCNSEGRIHPVAQKLPNSWGFFDMVGNVQEWVSDGEGVRNIESTVDPLVPLMDSEARAVRGCWRGSLPLNCRAGCRQQSARDILYPSDSDIGFRLARTAR
jgi:formylglycine-generating enzyme required for sulfatase activity